MPMTTAPLRNDTILGILFGGPVAPEAEAIGEHRFLGPRSRPRSCRGTSISASGIGPGESGKLEVRFESCNVCDPPAAEYYKTATGTAAHANRFADISEEHNKHKKN
eukprot:CAMPEP_0206602820 /NCGR_PEP_ID=MMETSP0325_2-20121206/47741_1 /ASSEMBLY_ACC=CAM_ASM_000347 /TAXON_ID=2866 /ORGANISM="Crypthecodinium cohnii, Strain Seligo" /LENGTH=106 /DNA_ID=CAMNT_0054115633 /DNA_START=1 /DNA_END=318 /DNA_ORIENTATION=+